MTGRSRLFTVLLAVLILTITFTAAGCVPSRQEHPIGSDVWIWEHKGNADQITLNEKLFAVIQNGAAQISLPPDGRAVTVALDKDGEPATIRATWGITITHEDYSLMSAAFSVYKSYHGQGQTGSGGWVILLLIVVAAGLLLFLYAGRLVNSWKLGGIFGGHDTAKSLLLFKAIGILLMIVGGIVLLVVIF